MSSDSELSELNNQVRLKAFEVERTQLVHEETSRILRQTQLDNEKINSKLEVCCTDEELHWRISVNIFSEIVILLLILKAYNVACIIFVKLTELEAHQHRLLLVARGRDNNVAAK